MEYLKMMNSTSLLLCIIVLAFYGCEDYLVETPVTSISTETFFDTEEDFRQALNATYASLQTLAGSNGGYWGFSEMRSDNTTFQYNSVDLSGHFMWNMDKFIMTPQNNEITNFWMASYRGIGKANSVINKSEEKEYKNKRQYVAEAKFLRALYYYYLVRYFGNVPLVLETATSYEDALADNKQVDKQQVYDQIMSDLNEAKSQLPVSYSNKGKGKATSGAARTLLAKVYMVLERYSDAASELEAVINSGVYKLLDDYAAVFDIDNENNQEIIFSVQFMEGPYGLSSYFMYRFTPWSAGRELIEHGQRTGRTGMNLPTTDLINSFELGDERKSLINLEYTHDTGYYKENIVPYMKKFWDPNHKVRLETGSNFPLFRYPHVLLMLAECYLKEGGNPTQLVNQVRIRAALPPITNVTLDDIIHERRVEFYGEADRWGVLVRTGRAVEVMKAHGEEQRENRPASEVGKESYQNIKTLYPIPAQAIQTDPSLEQNPDYQP